MQEVKASLGEQCLSTDDLFAERAIQFCQREKFSMEIASLESGKSKIRKNSAIYKLNPILEDGLLRAGGRLCKIAMPEEVKHPVILSKEQHISKLILKHIHEQTGHGGRNHILSTLRRKHWIIHANAAARKVL